MRLLVAGALGVLGIVLLYFGIRASDAFNSQVSEFFTGRPTDEALALLIGGGVALVLAVVLLFVGPKDRAD